MMSLRGSNDRPIEARPGCGGTRIEPSPGIRVAANTAPGPIEPAKIVAPRPIAMPSGRNPLGRAMVSGNRSKPPAAAGAAVIARAVGAATQDRPMLLDIVTPPAEVSEAPSPRGPARAESIIRRGKSTAEEIVRRGTKVSGNVLPGVRSPVLTEWIRSRSSSAGDRAARGAVHVG